MRWKWIGHILRNAPNYVTRHALNSNPQGQRRRGTPKNRLHRETETYEKDEKQLNRTRIEGPWQGELENVGQCSMLHCDGGGDSGVTG
ncbi:unnamed protein product [Schistosoma margrebowiei]|uniref:Uncharacterized protein n=1 Tax=Schistosoma margrebowiei TaxID=48269 RepID=A0A183MGG5_9TREM|nr:unnamed protein product [Schistosoma margrebowiei]